MSSTSTRSFSKWPVGSPEYTKEFVGGRTNAVSISFIIIEIILTALRFISRRVSKTHYGLDDLFIVPSLVFCLAIAALSIIMVETGGVGRHLPALATTDPGAILNWAKSLVAVEIIYCTAVVFPKLSILSFYLRIFTTKPYRIAAYFIGGILTANGLSGIITSLASCRPLAGRWDTALVASGAAKCINIDNFWRWISFANILTDVVMLGLPLPAVWKLHTSKNQKIGLTLIFLTGSVGLISSIVRFAIFFDTEGFIDGTWTSGTLMIWTVVEPGVYHIAVCLPTLRSLFLYMFKGQLSSTVETSGKAYGSHSGLNETKSIPLVTTRKVNDSSGFLRLENDSILIGQKGYESKAYGGKARSESLQSTGSLEFSPQKDTAGIRVTHDYTVRRGLGGS